MKKEEFDVILSEHLGETTEAWFRKVDGLAALSDVKFQVLCNEDCPEHASLHKGEVCTVVGFRGDKEYDSFAIEDARDTSSPWAVGHKYFDLS